MSQHRRPIWFAVLVTPWAVPLAFVLWSIFAVLFTEGVSGLKDWPVLLGFFVFALPVTYAAMLIIGLPYVLWLRARGALTFSFVCIGAVLAAIVAIPVFGWLTGPHIPPSGGKHPVVWRVRPAFGLSLLHRGRHNISSKRTPYRRLTPALAGKGSHGHESPVRSSSAGNWLCRLRPP